MAVGGLATSVPPDEVPVRHWGRIGITAVGFGVFGAIGLLLAGVVIGQVGVSSDRGLLYFVMVPAAAGTLVGWPIGTGYADDRERLVGLANQRPA